MKKHKRQSKMEQAEKLDIMAQAAEAQSPPVQNPPSAIRRF
jgi:hypothetical protein